MKSLQNIAKKVNKRYYYAEIVKKLIASEQDDSSKMLLIKYLLYYNSTHMMGRYSDGWLEREIIKLGKRHVRFQRNQEAQENHILMVMTSVASTGGHTALVNAWIQFDISRKYSIILTDCGRDQVPVFLKDSVKKSGGKIIVIHQKNDYAKAELLLYISQKYEKIVLVTHMYDVLPILAYSNKNWKTPVYFYNHANFSFSVGLSVSDCFMTMCDYDTYKAKKFRQANNVNRLSFPTKVIELDKTLRNMSKAEIKKVIMVQYSLPNMEHLIISMGEDFKYNKIIGYDFKEFVIQLLKAAPKNTYFLIIGADKNSKRWIELKKETNGKGIALGRLERDEVSKLMYASDIYVTSFPMDSSGLEEAWEYNVPIFNLQVTNRIKFYYNPCLCYTNIEELKNAIINVIKKPETYQINNIYSDTYHTTKKEWLKELDTIWKDALGHELYTFQGKKVITKEEIVNAQLLEKVNNYPFLQKKCLKKKYRMIIFLFEKLLGNE